MSRIAEIKRRLSAATPGPWHYPAKKGGLYVCFGNIQEDRIIAAVTHEQNEMALFKSNMKFIANAPEDIAYLLREIERKDKALDWYFLNWGTNNDELRLMGYKLSREALKEGE